MKKNILLPILTVLISFSQLFAQSAPQSAASGELLVKLKANANLSIFFEKLNRAYPTADFFLKKNVSEIWDIYLVGYDNAILADTEALDILQRDPSTKGAGYNAKVEYRNTEPDDSNWNSQWDMQLMNAPEAWDFTTGGVTPQGDTIVVAVLEKGYESEHSDLNGNLWRNWAEIPSNNIDDDNNGAVDDFLGYDIRNNTSSNGNGSSHGTSVMGIVGASGNNGVGVTGVNWDVKILPILNVENLDEIISAYEYVYRVRKRYNETNGAEGAFVVASNASFGISNAFPIENFFYLEWCALYDSLGNVGIVSMGATDNQNTDVDIQGDMPTTCPSPFLISVTNVAQDDMKPSNAAYGSTNIDLGAPGTGAHTTVNNNGYSNFSGTSSATPHVTGSLALLYALPCATVAQNALTEPASTATTMRSLILDHVSPNISLNGITSTGGRLDIGASMAAAEQLFCDGARSETLTLTRSTKANLVRHQVIQYDYAVPDYNFSYKVLVYAADGKLMVEKTLNPQEFQINSFEIDPALWPRGKYFVMVFQGREFVTDVFVKI